MSIRSQAPCLALFLAIAAICVAFFGQPQVTESSSSQVATVDAGLPPGQPVVVYYPAEQSSPQPVQKAEARAPFVNVYALYRQGAPATAGAGVQKHDGVREHDGAQEPGEMQEQDGETTRHILLAGQKTA